MEKKNLLFTFAALLAYPAIAVQGAILIQTGNIPKSDELNIFFQETQTGLTVFGDTNSNPVISVQFDSTQTVTCWKFGRPGNRDGIRPAWL